MVNMATIRQSIAEIQMTWQRDPLKVAKTTNSAKMVKVHQNRRKKLNKLIISFLFGGNGENGKNRQNLSRTSNEMAKGPL